MLNTYKQQIEHGEQNANNFVAQYKQQHPEVASTYEHLATITDLRDVELFLRDKLTPYATLIASYASDASTSFFADCARYQQHAVDALYFYACARQVHNLPNDNLFDGIATDEVLSTSSKQLLIQSVN